MQADNIILWLLGSSGTIIGLILTAWYFLNGSISKVSDRVSEVSERVSRLQGIQEGRQQAENAHMMENLMKSMAKSGSKQDG